MTVLYFADVRFPIERANGVQTMATCHALAARGHDVTLVVRPDTAPEARDPFEFYSLDRPTTLEVVAIPRAAAPQVSRVRFLLSALARAAAQRDAIVYTRDLGLAAFLLQVPRRRRPRVVYESHGVAAVVTEEIPRLLGDPALAPSPAKLQRLDRRDRRVWARAAAYVTITRALADELATRYGPRPDVYVVPDGSSEPAGHPLPGTKTRSVPIAAYAGHLYPWKGVDVFVRALACVPEVHGLIVGGHPQEPDRARVETLARELRLGGHLTITGLVPPGEVHRHLTAASMLLLPNTPSAISERYTSPLKLFEYLWLGKPLIASDSPAVREILDGSGAAILVPAGDAEALAGAIRQLAANCDLASSLGAAARRLAPDFTWSRRAARLEAALAVAART